MGFLDNGKWVSNRGFNINKDGAFDRPQSIFRETITSDGPFKPEANRYHLYVSLACPWAHRTLIMRSLKKLESIISVDVVHPDMEDNGWEFKANFDACTGDSLYQLRYLYELYTKADLQSSCRVTVPVLWDKHTKKIVNNESSEIIRILNSAFNEFTPVQTDFYPSHLQSDINQLNKMIYDSINNGVYKAGFAQTQNTYDTSVTALFNALDTLETHLKPRNFLVGDTLTEADIRLFPTLIRFDAVYHTHFKCNKKLIAQYPELQKYIKRLLTLPEFKTTTNLTHIKRHYYASHIHINPFQIIPIGAESI